MSRAELSGLSIVWSTLLTVAGKGGKESRVLISDWEFELLMGISVGVQ